jgi:hypothetical protein
VPREDATLVGGRSRYQEAKLGHFDSSYTRFNFVAMSLSPGRRAPNLPVGTPEARPAVGLADFHARRGTPHPPERPPAASPAGGPRPMISIQSPPSGTTAVKFAPTLGSILDSPPATAPMRRQLTPSIHSTSSTTLAIARGPGEGCSPNDATLARTAVPIKPIAPAPPPQPTRSSLDAAIRSPCAPNGKSPLVPLLSLRFPSPHAVFPPLPTPRFADALNAILAYWHLPTCPSEFRFEWSANAAAHNWELLRRYDLELGSTLRAQSFST